MKSNTFFKVLVIMCVLSVSIIFNDAYAQSIGINVTGALPNTKALLDVDATGSSPKKGLLIPRMTTTERNAITAPIPESLLIYNTTTQCFEAWNQTAGAWVSFGCINPCTVPSTATASVATSVAATSLNANWGAVAGATDYVLDISASSTFTSYTSSSVGNVTSYAATNLNCATTYYYRVRTNNACGNSANSNTITVTTGACPTPTTGACGTQIWMASNLNVGTQVNSTAAGSQQLNNGVVEKYCYNNVAANCATYGGLYEWDEMMNYGATINCDPCGAGGVQGQCPTGYHVPSDLEWSRYEFCLENTVAPVGSVSLNTFQTTIGYRGTNSVAGPNTKMKTTAGNTPAWDGTNVSGFNALPAGARNSADGSFVNLGSIAVYWTATESAAAIGLSRYLYSANGQVYRNADPKASGFSVRCLKD